ncbi:MAG: trypsin-like peptidase domain-containing protein [Defluviitaleaceae bacterium]|nr:trypsin-like peptidase domain-containing protein [Defluviitaleaceae bacterium]
MIRNYNNFEDWKVQDYGTKRRETAAYGDFIFMDEALVGYNEDEEERSSVEFYPVLVQPEETVGQPKKKQRGSIFKKVIAAVSIAALMLGSGVTGAMVTERRMVDTMNDMLQVHAQNFEAVAATAATAAFQQTGVIAVSEFNAARATLELTELFVGANPAVVAISTEVHGRNAFGRPVIRPSAGSGFIISNDGYIVTNSHVIEDANSISVFLYDGTSYSATVVGNDFHSDLAVLKIEAQGLSYLGFADSDAMMVGETIAAIGNPLGEFANSMTVGVVSALDREINIDGMPRIMLQTDAAINRGNSGGPLVDLQGQVVGVVTAKSAGAGVEGLGFAIPSNVAKNVVDNLINEGFVRGRAVMGVQIGNTQLGGTPRIFIETVVAGSAADNAGVQQGDIILMMNGAEVNEFLELRRIIDTLSPGDELTLVVFRDNMQREFTLILDEFRPN